MQIQKTKPGYKLVKSLFGKEIEIPEEWEIKKLGQIITKTQLGTGQVGVVGGKGIPLLKMGNLTFGKFNFNKLEKIPLSEVENGESYLLEKNDFLFNTRNSDILVGKCSVWKDNFPEAIFNNNLMRISFSQEVNNSDYISYFLNSPYGRLSLRKLVDRTTSVAAIYFGQLKLLKLFLPKIQEQQKITCILSDVDNLIDSYDKAIEYSTKLKRGLMQKLLTKGIGHKKFKKTRIGEIPDEWNFNSIQNVCDEVTLGVVNAATPYYTDQFNGIPYFRSQNVRENNLTSLNLAYVKPEFNKIHPKSILKENDVLTVQTGVKTGMTCIVPKEHEGCNCHSLLITRTDPKKLLPKYLVQFLNSNFGKKILSSFSMQSNRDHLLLEDWRLLKIPLPKIEEQQKIASILSEIDSKITDLESKKSRIESLMKGLMQKLLTGQIRV